MQHTHYISATYKQNAKSVLSCQTMCVSLQRSKTKSGIETADNNVGFFYAKFSDKSQAFRLVVCRSSNAGNGQLLDLEQHRKPLLYNVQNAKAMNEVSKAVESAIVTFCYEGSYVSFQNGDDVMVNATEMAKPFGKRTSDFLKSQQTKEFLQTLSEVRKIVSSDLVKVTYGDNGGTWMHQDVAIEFARWLSPAFAIWTNDRIRELLTQGVATVSNEDAIIEQAIQLLHRRLSDKQQLLQEAQSTIQSQRCHIKQLEPMADYTRNVLLSDSTITFEQCAKDLGFRSVFALLNALRASRILYRRSGQWLPYAPYANCGYFDTRTHCITHSDGSTSTKIYTVVTEQGRRFLHNRFSTK